jgi:hypothetical protein
LVGITGCVGKALVINEAIIGGKGIAGLRGFFAQGGGAFEVIFFTGITRSNAGSARTDFWAIAKDTVIQTRGSIQDSGTTGGDGAVGLATIPVEGIVVIAFLSLGLDSITAGGGSAIGVTAITVGEVAIITLFTAGENEGITALGQLALGGAGAAIRIIGAVVAFFLPFEKRVTAGGGHANRVFAKVIGWTLVIGGTQGDALPMGAVL